MLVAQLTDLHLPLPGSPPKYGKDAAVEFAAAIRRLNELSVAPDVVIITGDLVDSGEAAEYDRVAEILGDLNHRSLLIPGNHDARGPMRSRLADDHPELSQCDDFIQWVIDDLPVRLIGLDTLIPGRGTGELCEDRLAWLAEQLARGGDRPTMIAMHHPPFDTGVWWMDRMGMERGHGELRKMVEAHPNVVRILCGHQHRSVTTNWGPTVLSICPSAWTQLLLDLGPEAPPHGIAEPGAIQLHRWTGTNLVTHTEYIHRLAEPVDFRDEWVEDWPTMRDQLRAGTRGV